MVKSHRITGGGGIGLHVAETGDATARPILFIHGFSQCWLAWGRQFDSDLADDHRLVALVDDAGLSYLHVFPFSPRKGTPAAKMPQLPVGVVRERARRLRAKGEEALAARLRSLVGSEQELLVEKPAMGRTGCFACATFEGTAAAGSLVRAHIESCDGRTLRARVLPFQTQGVRASA